MKFSNDILNEKFEMNCGDADPEIDVKGYRGKLSNVPTEEILEGMVKRRSNLVKKKITEQPLA